MDNTTRRLMMGAAGAVSPTYVEDVFSTWLYTGNGSTQTITNGIDLSGKGGLVWCKSRSAGSTDHILTATPGKALKSNLTNAEQTTTRIDAFNSNGFFINNTSTDINQNGDTYASWTFRKQAKFFDVVTFTTGTNATSSNRRISHSLGSVPGLILLKVTTTTDNWYVYHRSAGRNQFGNLNTISTFTTTTNAWGTSDPTSTDFGVNEGAFCTDNQSYVAYLFAHDAGGFGDSGNDSVVKCGSYTGNGSTSGPTVTLGWEPQWLMIKGIDNTSDWQLIDNMRGFVVGGTDAVLNPNLSNAESTGTFVTPTSTGFQLNTTDTGYNANTGTFIYIAIRRGPMKTPTDATKVFSANTSSGSAGTAITTGFPVDMQISTQRTDSLSLACGATNDRLRGASSTDTQTILNLFTHSTSAEGTSGTGSRDWSNTGFDMPSYPATLSTVFWNFRRAPGFFDAVAYTGTGSARTVSHNLGVAPELMIVKSRNITANWAVYSAATGNSNWLRLNTTDSSGSAPGMWNSTSPTATVFTVGTSSASNDATGTFIAYLFASCPGVSKVGSYTGTGTTLQINCGFTSGARFVMIKRTDSTGDWYVWDSARGIVAGNDPYLLLNSTAAEVTGTDYVDTFSAGFEISSTAPAAINANGGSYIYLSVA